MPLDLKKAKPSKGGDAKLPVYGSLTPMTAGLPVRAKPASVCPIPAGSSRPSPSTRLVGDKKYEQQDSALQVHHHPPQKHSRPGGRIGSRDIRHGCRPRGAASTLIQQHDPNPSGASQGSAQSHQGPQPGRSHRFRRTRCRYAHP